MTLNHYFQDFLSLFFPELCAGCGTNLFRNEDVICTNCIYQLPVTNFHKDPLNKLAKQLWGRFIFCQACSYVYFRKGSRIQNIMHQLKYNKRPEAGVRMGKLYAYVLNSSVEWYKPDLIVPVPLHPQKLKQRGYNQSESISQGLASVLHIPVLSDHLTRIENTETQTRKSRFERYENLKSAFYCKDKISLAGKHILLVDDVMTTGATLEACAAVLLGVEGTVISIVTLAFTE
ncbi:MAG: ComF family protein [Daejeonella sp.]